MQRNKRPRIFLDVSSLVRWTGPAVGILRVEAALAEAARRRPGSVLVAWDPTLADFRRIDERWADLLIGWTVAVDPPLVPRQGFRRFVPSRLPIIHALERRRIAAGNAFTARAVEFAQLAVLSVRRHSYPWRDAEGRRIPHVTEDVAFGPPPDLAPGDVVLSAGAGWGEGVAERLAEMRGRLGIRYASLCYDLLPITHPDMFRPLERNRFVRHWRQVFAFADLLIVNADCIAEDARRLGLEIGSAPRIAVAPLGRTPPEKPSGGERLPAGLREDRFALFVSTVEPRKGHALLLRVWRRLLARGIPQAHGFGLVFVGREGWLVDDVMRELADPPLGIHHLPRASDGELAALYRASSFSLYPSLYEGFGLPLIESFAYGKTAIVSDGGALPQTARSRALVLPVGDEDAWEAALAAWIADPSARAPYEARLAAAQPDPDWPEAADRILDLVARELA